MLAVAAAVKDGLSHGFMPYHMERLRQCIGLYCIVLYCIVLYWIVLDCIGLYCIVLYCIALYWIVWIVLYCIALHIDFMDSTSVDSGGSDASPVMSCMCVCLCVHVQCMICLSSDMSP
jgi:hypothetical protein